MLKWAGGKRWLVPIIKPMWSGYSDLKLVEPFTGGMAVTLDLAPQRSLLNDANEHLINFYQQVREGLTIRKLFKNESAYYYAQRERFNQLIKTKKHNSKEAAALFYYLIKTGFNGLCRFNSQGEFNVPFGQHKQIIYKKTFDEYQNLISPWTFQHGDFENIILQGDEFIYADPPYDVEFTKYCAKGFDWADQQRLAQWLNHHQGPLIISNQATPRMVALYQTLKFKVYTLDAPRSIACTGNRTPALEMLAFKNIDLKSLNLFKGKLKKV